MLRAPRVNVSLQVEPAVRSLPAPVSKSRFAVGLLITRSVTWLDCYRCHRLGRIAYGAVTVQYFDAWMCHPKRHSCVIVMCARRPPTPTLNSSCGCDESSDHPIRNQKLRGFAPEAIWNLLGIRRTPHGGGQCVAHATPVSIQLSWKKRQFSTRPGQN